MKHKTAMRHPFILTVLLGLSAAALTACETTRIPDADAVDMFLARAQACAHWNGEEATDETRRGQITEAQTELRCSTVVRDGEALKVSRRDRPDDLVRIEAALVPLR